ncbi:unnamed protein product [Closterium sp. Naga37s-1]|nr:unnamed protein product [Closterium sp. Naga37s-1]
MDGPKKEDERADAADDEEKENATEKLENAVVDDGEEAVENEIEEGEADEADGGEEQTEDPSGEQGDDAGQGEQGDGENGENGEDSTDGTGEEARPLLSSSGGAAAADAAIAAAPQPAAVAEESSAGGGWGSWGGGWAAALSVVTAIQEVATEVTGEISHAATVAAKEIIDTFEDVEGQVAAEGDGRGEGKGVGKGEGEGGAGAQAEEKTGGGVPLDGAAQQAAAVGTAGKGKGEGGEGQERGDGAGGDDAAAAAAAAGESGGGQAESAEGAGAESVVRQAPAVVKAEMGDGGGSGGREKWDGAGGGGAEAGRDDVEDGAEIVDPDFKAFDESMENLTSGALHVLGSAWMGGLSLVHQLEQSTGAVVQTIQQQAAATAAITTTTTSSGSEDAADAHAAGMGSVSILESGMGMAEQGMRMLEALGKNTIDIISLEALADHHTVVCIRARGKLPAEQRAAFDDAVKHMQGALTLGGQGGEGEDGDEDEDEGEGEGGAGEELLGIEGMEEEEDEMNVLRESSVSKAQELASGFRAKLSAEVAVKEAVQRTVDRLDALRTEGVHRLSELSALCLLHMLHIANSCIASPAAKPTEGDAAEEEEDTGSFRWPAGREERATLVVARARTLARGARTVIRSFLKGVADVEQAFQSVSARSTTGSGSKKEPTDAAAEGETGEEAAAAGAVAEAEAATAALVRRVEVKKGSVADGLVADGKAAREKLESALQHLVYVVMASSIGLTHAP